MIFRYFSCFLLRIIVSCIWRWRIVFLSVLTAFSVTGKIVCLLQLRWNKKRYHKLKQWWYTPALHNHGIYTLFYGYMWSTNTEFQQQECYKPINGRVFSFLWGVKCCWLHCTDIDTFKVQQWIKQQADIKFFQQFFFQVLIDTQLDYRHLHLFLIKWYWVACMYSQHPRRANDQVIKLPPLTGCCLPCISLIWLSFSTILLSASLLLSPVISGNAKRLPGPCRKSATSLMSLVVNRESQVGEMGTFTIHSQGPG